MFSVRVGSAARRCAAFSCLTLSLGLAGCDDSTTSDQDPVGPGGGSDQMGGEHTGGQSAAAPGGSGTSGVFGGNSGSGMIGSNPGVGTNAGVSTGAWDSGVQNPVPSDTDAGGAAVDPTQGPPPAAGPVDGDPSRPVVSIPEVRCGPATGVLDGLVGNNFAGLPPPGDTNVTIGGRDVIVSYPCDKHEGAHVTFILNLHGTMPLEELKLYQHSYFAAHKLATSHNLIVVSPKSVVAQWTNGDDGRDLPHLYEVIDWVYEKFSKFQITGLWIGGHSWGSMFAKQFVCDEMLTDKVRGVIGMSGGPLGVGGGDLLGGLFGGGGGGACADRISQIHTVGDADIPGVPDQSATATAHGCDGKTAPQDVGNGQLVEEWPNCDPGWVHLNITMGAHDHVTPINPEIVELIVEKIKSTEAR